MNAYTPEELANIRAQVKEAAERAKKAAIASGSTVHPRVRELQEKARREKDVRRG